METFLFAAAGDGYDLAVDAASGSLGAGRERRDPSADEPLPALHQLNRRRKATTFSFFRCSRSRVLHATRSDRVSSLTFEYSSSSLYSDRCGFVGYGDGILPSPRVVFSLKPSKG
ncbi:hypothetical protein BHM03_00022044 [Ensete ventricosum]|nr:hypothetical protein BHM03_00022044 [Ensete ventricosum]